MFAMPSAAGELQRVANVPMVLAAATQIASALKHLHAHNIIHSDLSLMNVLLAQPPPGSGCSIHCKVRDFAIFWGSSGGPRALSVSHFLLSCETPCLSNFLYMAIFYSRSALLSNCITCDHLLKSHVVG